jgi:hypothetical protein
MKEMVIEFLETGHWVTSDKQKKDGHGWSPAMSISSMKRVIASQLGTKSESFKIKVRLME